MCSSPTPNTSPVTQHGSFKLLILKSPFPEAGLLPFQLTYSDASHDCSPPLPGSHLLFTACLSNSCCSSHEPSCLHLPFSLSLDSTVCHCKHPGLPLFSLHHHTLLVKIRQNRAKQQQQNNLTNPAPLHLCSWTHAPCCWIRFLPMRPTVKSWPQIPKSLSNGPNCSLLTCFLALSIPII